MLKKIKRLLFLLHRWLGVAMCLFIALWFASGIIMMYVEYPELTEEERLAMLPVLESDAIRFDLEQALDKAGIAAGNSSVRSVRLSSVAGRPAYIVETSAGIETLFADTGEKLGEVTPELALASADASGFVTGAASASYTDLIDDDQWSISSGLNRHRPLYKVAVDDGKGTVLYLSSLTGEIMRDTHRSERVWNWLGSTIHWIYPVQLRRHGGLWNDVIVYLSLVGLLSIVTGAIIGFMRLRLKRRFRNGSVTPYRGMDKWHHVLGLVCLIFVTTFMFSGLMSMGPWGIFASEKAAGPQIARFVGGSELDIESSPALPLNRWPAGVKEVQWQQIGGESYLVLSKSADERLVLLPGTEQAEIRPQALQEKIMHKLPAMLPEANIVSLTTLQEYDDYYYSRHNRYRPLPAYRVRFDDSESTWYHVDLNTGQVVSRHTDGSRLGRWLYNGLHSLDFSFLTRNGLLWDVTVILLSLFGLVFSVTSVVIGWRRLSNTVFRSTPNRG